MTTEEQIGKKENLAWFQQRRDRWRNAPRPKVKPLTPQKPEISAPTLAAKSNSHTIVKPSLDVKIDGEASAVSLTAASSSESKPNLSSGGAATASSIPRFGASPLSSTNNSFSFGSTSQQSAANMMSTFANVQISPSSSTAIATSKASLVGNSTSTSAFKPTAPPAGTSINSTFPLSKLSSFSKDKVAGAQTPSIFGGLNLESTTPAMESAGDASSAPSKTSADKNSTGSNFASVRLSGTMDLGPGVSKSSPPLQEGKPKMTLTECKPFSFPYRNNDHASNQFPLTKPQGKMRNSTATTNGMIVTPIPAAPQTAANATPSFVAPAPSASTGFIFPNANLAPDVPAPTSTAPALLTMSSTQSGTTNLSGSEPTSIFWKTNPSQTVSPSDVSKESAEGDNEGGSSSSQPIPFSFSSQSGAKSSFQSSAPSVAQVTMNAPTASARTSPSSEASKNSSNSILPNIKLDPNAKEELSSKNNPSDAFGFGSGIINSKPMFGAASSPSPFTSGVKSATLSSSATTAIGSTSNQEDNDKAKSSQIGTESSAPEAARPGIDQGSRSNKARPSADDKPSIELQSDYKSRLIAFYKKHNPDKLDTVDSTLEKYKGKEVELFQKLQSKYEAATTYPLPSGEGPSCFLEFTIGGNLAGKVIVKLFHDRVPLACDNFKTLCTGAKGNGRMGKPLCYKNSKVHRVVPLFCVQMGDLIRGDGTGGESIYEPNTSGVSDGMGRFKDEAFLQHSKKGLLSMANNGPNRNGSQFFFTLRPCPNLNGKHVVFGEVTSGMDVVERIGNLKTTPKQDPEETVDIINCGEIVNGKEVPCEVATTKAPSPFTFGSTMGAGSSKPLGFNDLAASATRDTAFGTNVPGASPFTFGTVASTLQSKGGFNTFSSSITKPFDEGSSGTAEPGRTATSLSFGSSSGASAGMPSFGSLATSASSTKGSFAFGPTTAGSKLGNDSPFSFGAKTADGSMTILSPPASEGLAFRSAKRDDDDESDDESSKSDDSSDED